MYGLRGVNQFGKLALQTLGDEELDLFFGEGRELFYEPVQDLRIVRLLP